jgi:hypothetical protein
MSGHLKKEVLDITIMLELFVKNMSANKRKVSVAIKVCKFENPHRNYINRNSSPLSNSQAAIKAPGNYQINSKLVWNFHPYTETIKNTGNSQ